MPYIAADLRRLVIERAGGCCEYCRLNQEDSDLTFHIEHIIAVSHGGKTNEANLALSCPRCNLLKGTNIAAADPQTDDPTFLYHPRLNNWKDHFVLESTGIKPTTAVGRVTVMLLRLNEAARLEQREVLFALGRYPCSTTENDQLGN